MCSVVGVFFVFFPEAGKEKGEGGAFSAVFFGVQGNTRFVSFFLFVFDNELRFFALR